MTVLAELKPSHAIRLFILYTLTNFFLLINVHGIYWDDWSITFQQANTILNIFHQCSSIVMGYLHVLLQKLGNGIYVYRISSFSAYFLSSIFIFYIVQNIKYLDKTDSFFIALFFLLLPLDHARIALVNATPILFLFIFYLAFFLLTHYLNSKRKLYIRLLILGLFFLSFNVESLIVFYSVVLCYIFFDRYQKNKVSQILNTLKQFFIRYADFICLPILFFTIKHYFFKPFGLYIGYNAVNLNIKAFLILLTKSFLYSLFLPIYQALRTSLDHLALTACIFISVHFTLKNIVPLACTKKQGIDYVHMLFLGLLLFLLAVIPYCAVGKLPQIDSWGSRNQLLIPAGLAFILYSLISLSVFINKKLPTLLIYVFSSMFIVQGLYSYYMYDMDWFYQMSLQEQFKQSALIRNHSTIIAQDNLEMDVWVYQRGLSFYEVNGIMKRAFKEDSRMLVHTAQSIKDFQQYRDYPQYNFTHWINNPPVFVALSKNKQLELDWNKTFRLFFDDLFNQKAFNREVKELTEIKETSPIS